MTAAGKIKHRSRGAKRRAKKARITLAGGESVEQRPTGRDRTHTHQPDTSPPPIIAARASRCGLDSASTLHESDMGRCIIALSDGDDRRDMTDAWHDLSAARRNYRLRIIGASLDPQGIATPMQSDAMQTDPSLRIDTRTADERDDAARKRWQAWDSRIKALPTPQHAWAIRAALDGFMGDETLWRDGSPTVNGRVAVAALYILTRTQ